MNVEEFEELIQKFKVVCPHIFELESDSTPTMEDIGLIENNYGIVFPKSYRDFLLRYGGGYFGYTVVYSLDDQSPFYVLKNVAAEFVRVNGFFPVIDFETGDLAGFKMDHGVCEDSVMLYDHETMKVSDLKMNFYDVLGKYGLQNN